MNNDATRHLAADSFLFPLPEPSAIGRLPVDGEDAPPEARADGDNVRATCR